MTTQNEERQITGVWQNGGRSAKLSICTSINICANLNICTSNPPLRQAPKRFQNNGSLTCVSNTPVKMRPLRFTCTQIR